VIDDKTADELGVSDEVRAAAKASLEQRDAIPVKGHVKIELTREDGTVDVEEVDNIITTVGRAMLADLVLAATSGGATKPTHIGVGTSGTAAAVGDTTITGETRVALTTKTRAANVLTFVGDWAAGVATGTLQETGLWDAVSAGNLTGRATFGPQTKGASDTLKVTWTWTIG
jgi:hypothetical protein